MSDPNITPTKKLTKRQKKTNAFRDKKKAKLDNSEQNSLIAHSQNKDEAQASDTPTKSKERNNSNDKNLVKLEKFATKDDTTDYNNGSQFEKEETNQNTKRINKNTEKKSRYIVFVANLPYSATKEEINKHFETNGATPISIRLITDKMTEKPKGFAFVEFEDSITMEYALGFHNTVFKNKQIRVELTSGGGGNKSEFRRKKIEEKNKKLEEERRKLHEKNKKISSETGGSSGTRESKNKLINSDDIDANVEYHGIEDIGRKKRREANHRNIDKQQQKKPKKNFIKSSEQRISKPRNVEGANAINPFRKMRKFGSDS
ncbi:7048_t:CDS:2 [Ambispora gerdemannii]|uniref:7048_t:CDS:1 n=1 Tax=Ambispora gerdemannii TaxID=144530 RepID=A0A9N9F6Q5_9GLOM|nr:7048_t:CDS:2 [Ambispora gerdemannii]